MVLRLEYGGDQRDSDCGEVGWDNQEPISVSRLDVTRGKNKNKNKKRQIIKKKSIYITEYKRGFPQLQMWLECVCGFCAIKRSKA